MADTPKEQSIPVEEMAGNGSPEVVKQIASRIKDLKSSADSSARLIYMGLFTVVGGGINLAGAYTDKSDSQTILASTLIAIGATTSFMFHHWRSKDQGEANALTGALAQHLLDSVEKNQTADSPKSQP